MWRWDVCLSWTSATGSARRRQAHVPTQTTKQNILNQPKNKRKEDRLVRGAARWPAWAFSALRSDPLPFTFKCLPVIRQAFFVSFGSVQIHLSCVSANMVVLFSKAGHPWKRISMSVHFLWIKRNRHCWTPGSKYLIFYVNLCLIRDLPYMVTLLRSVRCFLS